jgi:preprotein translocase subunit YajC
MDPTTLVMITLMIVAFYFLILRPQKKRQQAVQATLRALTPGDRVMLGSGIFGTIVSMGDRQAVVEISPGVHLTVVKQAIVRAATDADEDSPVEEYDDDEVEEPHVLEEPRAGGATAATPVTDHSSPSAGADTTRLS